ncbi:NADP-dependent oxidoreductase domain-containing protein [Neohortaea acidophila]|uniref:NADP-dependent oxidoreductase domain-containing protein n=1 Tax=Neohortaea acidophila TaxID=245834 RepID=A0A6A6PSL4_9PEZI|nr:NADP-dependent oxidoreductase domain-containing protein [Neohortaea acidophila]KAF2482875.1 NADP-dependent oxidoreductase domain-containing protein [Neohortaea acidophila]
MALSNQSTYKLPTGHAIPAIGLGVWDSPSNVTVKTCLEALKRGYRLIDTAEGYHNETEVGEALKQSGLPRDQVFITTKIYEPGEDAEATRQKLLNGINKSGGEGGYVDLLLIHNADVGARARKLIWQQLEALHKEGRIKSIGVSNFGIQHLEQLKEYATVWPPAINQLELHPWLQQREVVDWCKQNGIVLEAYCPLVRNQKANDEVLNSIAKQHDKTTAQILIRYCLQKGWIPLPKSDNPKRIQQNFDVFGWEIDAAAMKKLDAMPQEAALCYEVDNKDRS